MDVYIWTHVHLDIEVVFGVFKFRLVSFRFARQFVSSYIIFLSEETTPVFHNAVPKVVPEMGRMNIVNESGEIGLTLVWKRTHTRNALGAQRRIQHRTKHNQKNPVGYK